MHSTGPGQCQRPAIVHVGSLAWLTGAPKWSRATSNVISYTWQANCLLCERERSLLAAPIRAVLNRRQRHSVRWSLRHTEMWAGLTADGLSSGCRGVKERSCGPTSSSQNGHMLKTIGVTYISPIRQEVSTWPGHVDTAGWKHINIYVCVHLRMTHCSYSKLMWFKQYLLCLCLGGNAIQYQF